MFSFGKSAAEKQAELKDQVRAGHAPHAEAARTRPLGHPCVRSILKLASNFLV
jgi:hypothetical protein